MLLPSQAFVLRHPETPEKLLAIAVMEDALRTLCSVPAEIDWNHKPHLKRARRSLEAGRWFLSDDTSWVFSFARICQTFSLDEQAVRLALRDFIVRALSFAPRFAARCEHGECCYPKQAASRYCQWHQGGKDHPGPGRKGIRALGSAAECDTMQSAV